MLKCLTRSGSEYLVLGYIISCLFFPFDLKEKGHWLSKDKYGMNQTQSFIEHFL